MKMTPQDCYISTYNSIVSSIKSKGIKVIHRTIKSDAGATYDPSKNIITVDKYYKNTLIGCYYLLHEYQHFVQYETKKFPGFFSIRAPFTDKKMTLIINAEMDAIIQGVESLKKWGLSYTPSELKKGGLAKSIEFWKDFFFNR